MGKKKDQKNTGEGLVGSAAAAEKPAKKAKTPAPPAAPKRRAAAPKKPASSTPAAATITTDDIALRAYFISEKRRQHGVHGSHHDDWHEAERQLRAELKKPKKKA